MIKNSLWTSRAYIYIWYIHCLTPKKWVNDPIWLNTVFYILIGLKPPGETVSKASNIYFCYSKYVLFFQVSAMSWETLHMFPGLCKNLQMIYSKHKNTQPLRIQVCPRNTLDLELEPEKSDSWGEFWILMFHIDAREFLNIIICHGPWRSSHLKMIVLTTLPAHVSRTWHGGQGGRRVVVPQP